MRSPWLSERAVSLQRALYPNGTGLSRDLGSGKVVFTREFGLLVGALRLPLLPRYGPPNSLLTACTRARM
jgi:hypothetical protein